MSQANQQLADVIAATERRGEQERGILGQQGLLSQQQSGELLRERMGTIAADIRDEAQRGFQATETQRAQEVQRFQFDAGLALQKLLAENKISGEQRDFWTDLLKGVGSALPGIGSFAKMLGL